MRGDNGWVIGSLALCALAATFGAGCTQFSVTPKQDGPSTTNLRLRATRHAQITDVPTPEGFMIEDELSEDYATPGWRFVRYVYTGQSPRRSVLNFYREQMPMNSWTYISRQSKNGHYTLRFEKPNETCEVVIEPASGQSGGSGTRVRIEVKPLRRSGRMKDEARIE